MADCQTIAALITPYVDGVATADDRRRVDVHVARCGACQCLLAEEEGARQLVRARAADLQVPLPPGLLTHIQAIRHEAAEAARRAPAGRGWRAGVPRSLTVGASALAALALLVVVTANSTTVMAAQLVLDHIKCFRIQPGQTEAGDVRRAELELEQRYGWHMRVPPSSPDGLQLLGARRCLSGDGRIAHILYRQGELQVSLFRLDRGGDAAASLTSLGRQARIWSNAEHTYVVVADRATPEFEQIAAYLRDEAQ